VTASPVSRRRRGSARFDARALRACSADAILVADTGNHAIRRIDIGERTVKTLAGTGRRGSPLGPLRPARQVALASPWELELDGTQVFIANAGTHQLALLDLERGRLGLLAGNGREALVDGAAYEASLAQPSALVLDDIGEMLYFIDSESSAVRALSLEGQRRVSTICGRGLFEFGHMNGPFAKALFQHPLGVTWNDGALLVSDSYNAVMRRLDLEKGSVSDVDDGFMCEDALSLPLAEPSGVWADGAGRVLVADTNNHRIVEYGSGSDAGVPGRLRITARLSSAADNPASARFRCDRPPCRKPAGAAPRYRYAAPARRTVRAAARIHA
jgi:hypothetical protein